MADFSVGPGSRANNAASSVEAKDVSKNPLNFSVQDRGTATTELLRGRIGQMKTTSPVTPKIADQVSLRELPDPSLLTMKVLEKLQDSV